MWTWYELLSFVSMDQITRYKQEVGQGRNPRDIKVLLAQEIVARFHSQAAAEEALAAFNHRAKGGVPDDIASVTVDVEAGGMPLGALLRAAGLCATSSEGNRAIDQGGCKIDGETATDKHLRLPAGEYVIQVGKRRFAKVTVALK